jgi:hypothetical protein
MNRSKIFWLFGSLQSLTLGIIIFLIFNSLNQIAAHSVIGFDTQIVLSIIFPLFLLLVEYTIFSNTKST